MSLNTPSSSDIPSGFLDYSKKVAGNIQAQSNQVRSNLEVFSDNQLKHYLDSLQSYRVGLPLLRELLGSHIQHPVTLKGDESREELESRLSLELKIISAYSGAILRSDDLFIDSIPENALTNLMCIDYEITDMHIRSIRNGAHNLTENTHNQAISLL